MNYYVYTHIRESDGKIFYVGKGKNRRAWCTTGRNERWTRTYKKHGLIVEILFSGLCEQEAYQAEKDVIAELLYFKEPLCNMTAGGDSPPLKKGLDHPSTDKKVYSFSHKNGEVFVGTRQDFFKKTACNSGSLSMLISGKYKSVGGWRLSKTSLDGFGKSGKRNGRYNPDRYLFLHRDGTEEVCSKFELVVKYPELFAGNVASLMYGRMYTYKGWKCICLTTVFDD